MHLKNRPTYFVKNGIRKPVYYTVDARQLTEEGWVIEQEEKPTAKIVEPKQPEVTEEEESTDEEESLDDMTRAELIDFATANDIDFKSSASKAEILEACKEFVNG